MKQKTPTCLVYEPGECVAGDKCIDLHAFNRRRDGKGGAPAGGGGSPAPKRGAKRARRGGEKEKTKRKRNNASPERTGEGDDSEPEAK